MRLFVNDLTVIDFSYLCPERGMVGESWIVDVVLNGELNEESMVLDFGRVKKDLKALIDLHVDHKLLVPVDHPYTRVEHIGGSDAVKVYFNRPGKSIYLNCPGEAYAFVYGEQVSMTSVTQYLKEIMATQVPGNVAAIELKLRAEHIDSPYYHYTHGLKKHDGNCQRIAHGHRSRVDVQQDGVSSAEWQQYWATRWRDIYIGTREDLVARFVPTASAGHDLRDDSHYLFAYQASQGTFELAIPKAECQIVEVDSTVECLAQYMAAEQKRLQPGRRYEVIAFEGVGKGAIAYA